MIDDSSNKILVRKVAWFLAVFSLLTMTVALMTFTRSSDKDKFGAAWSSKAQPFSTVNPASLNVITVDRPFRSELRLLYIYELANDDSILYFLVNLDQFLDSFLSEGQKMSLKFLFRQIIGTKIFFLAAAM